MMRSDDRGQVFVAQGIFLIVLLVIIVYAIIQWYSGCNGTSLILFGIAALLSGFQTTRVLGARGLQFSVAVGAVLLFIGGYLTLFAGYC